MPNNHLKLILLFALICLILLAVRFGVSSDYGELVTQPTNTFYTCPYGFEFEVSAQAARCVRYPAQHHVGVTGCTDEGTMLQVDSIAQRDVCVVSGSGSQGSSPTCPVDYILSVQPGNDLCMTQVPGRIVPPMVKTERR